MELIKPNLLGAMWGGIAGLGLAIAFRDEAEEKVPFAVGGALAGIFIMNIIAKRAKKSVTAPLADQIDFSNVVLPHAPIDQYDS